MTLRPIILMTVIVLMLVVFDEYVDGIGDDRVDDGDVDYVGVDEIGDGDDVDGGNHQQYRRQDLQISSSPK